MPMIRSCNECQKRKIKCNRVFPCTACIARGDADTCTESESKRSKAPRIKYASEQTVNKLVSYVQRLEAALQNVPLDSRPPQLGNPFLASVPLHPPPTSQGYGMADPAFVMNANSWLPGMSNGQYVDEDAQRPFKKVRSLSEAEILSMVASSAGSIHDWTTLAQAGTFNTANPFQQPDNVFKNPLASGSTAAASVTAQPAPSSVAGSVFSPLTNAMTSLASNAVSSTQNQGDCILSDLKPFEMQWDLGACMSNPAPLGPPVNNNAAQSSHIDGALWPSQRPGAMQLADQATEQLQTHLLGNATAWHQEYPIESAPTVSVRTLSTDDAKSFIELLPTEAVFSILMDSLLSATHQVIGHIFHAPSLRAKLDWVLRALRKQEAVHEIPFDDVALLFGVLSVAVAHLDSRFLPNGIVIVYLSQQFSTGTSSSLATSTSQTAPSTSPAKRKAEQATAVSSRAQEAIQMVASKTWAKACLRALEKSACIFHLSLPAFQAAYLLEVLAISTALSTIDGVSSSLGGGGEMPDRARLEALSSVVVHQMRKLGLHRMRKTESTLKMPWSLAPVSSSVASKSPDSKRPDEIADSLRLEMVRRTFWAFENILAHQALAIDGIFAFPIEQIDTDLPWNADDDDLVIKPDDVHTDLSYTRLFAALRPITAEMSRLFHPPCSPLFIKNRQDAGVDTVEDYNAVLAIDRKIQDFTARLPSFYQLEDGFDGVRKHGPERGSVSSVAQSASDGSCSTVTTTTTTTATSTTRSSSASTAPSSATTPWPPGSLSPATGAKADQSPPTAQTSHEDVIRLERYLLHQSLAHKLIRLHRSYVRKAWTDVRYQRSAEVAASASLRLLKLQRKIYELFPSFVHFGYAPLQTITAVLLLVVDLVEKRTKPEVVPAVHAEINAAQARLDLLDVGNATLDRTRRVIRHLLERAYGPAGTTAAPNPTGMKPSAVAPTPPIKAVKALCNASDFNGMLPPPPPPSSTSGSTPSFQSLSGWTPFAPPTPVPSEAPTALTSMSSAAVPMGMTPRLKPEGVSRKRRASSTRSAWPLLNEEMSSEDEDGVGSMVSKAHTAPPTRRPSLAHGTASSSVRTAGTSQAAPMWPAASKEASSFADEYRWAANMLDTLLSTSSSSSSTAVEAPSGSNSDGVDLVQMVARQATATTAADPRKGSSEMPSPKTVTASSMPVDTTLSTTTLGRGPELDVGHWTRGDLYSRPVAPSHRMSISLPVEHDSGPLDLSLGLGTGMGVGMGSAFAWPT